MRCEACGATNPIGARWCNQCLTALGEAGDGGTRATDSNTSTQTGGPPRPPGEGTAGPPAQPPSRPLTPDDAAEPVPGRHAEPSGSHSAPRESRRAGTAAARGFRRREGIVEWACPTCHEYVGVEHTSCPVCGTPVFERFARPEKPRQAVPPLLGLVLTVVLPGAGHVAVGQYGTGIARGLLYVLWLSGSIAMATTPGPAGMAVAVPMLLGALLLWLGSLADVLTLQGAALGSGASRGGGRQLLDGRTLLWLVVGVTMLTLLGAVGAAGSGSSLS